jgi:hypothetical protein
VKIRESVFEASDHYYYLPLDLMEKVVNCRHILDTSFADADGGS